MLEIAFHSLGSLGLNVLSFFCIFVDFSNVFINRCKAIVRDIHLKITEEERDGTMFCYGFLYQFLT